MYAHPKTQNLQAGAKHVFGSSGAHTRAARAPKEANDSPHPDDWFARPEHARARPPARARAPNVKPTSLTTFVFCVVNPRGRNLSPATATRTQSTPPASPRHSAPRACLCGQNGAQLAPCGPRAQKRKVGSRGEMWGRVVQRAQFPTGQIALGEHFGGPPWLRWGPNAGAPVRTQREPVCAAGRGCYSPGVWLGVVRVCAPFASLSALRQVVKVAILSMEP